MKIRQGCKIRRICGSAVIIPPASAAFNGIITLNETAEFFFTLLENGINGDEAIDKICEEYTVDRQTAADDFADFLQQLERKGLIE